MPLVSCSQCKGFIKDLLGSGQGIGKCRAYEQYVRKGYSNSALRVELVALGNEPGINVFWGGLAVDRHCNRFIPVVE